MSLVVLVKSGCDSLPAGLVLRSRALGDIESTDESSPLRDWGCGPNLKICTVSVAEETQRREEVALNDMLYIREGIEPRRNW